MREQSKARTLGTAIAAGLVVLLLWNAGDADILGVVIPVWMVASITFGIGRAVAEIK